MNCTGLIPQKVIPRGTILHRKLARGYLSRGNSSRENSLRTILELLLRCVSLKFSEKTLLQNSPKMQMVSKVADVEDAGVFWIL